MQLPAFDKEGHRGCRGLMPENTIPAMLKAIDLGVTTLEMDVVITKDRQVILSHDPFFNHEITTRPDGTTFDAAAGKDLKIYGMTYAETQRYDVGLKPNPRFPRQQKMAVHKPRLSELIDTVEAYINSTHNRKVFYNIETKSTPGTDNVLHPAPAEFVDLLVGVIQRKGLAGRVIIQSFDFRTLQVVHQKYPSVRTAALIEDFDKRALSEQLAQLGFVPTVYSPHYSLVTPALLDSCHGQGIKVIAWTVNDRDTITKLTSMGVDGIITDYPDLF